MDGPLVAPVHAGALKTSRVGASDLSELERRLGWSFTRRELLDRALTHLSAASAEAERVSSYQRLEFLGDRVLGLVVASMLYETFSSANEGELSQRLAHLVRRETCAEVAAEWGVSPFIRLGAGEAQTGGRKKQAILADVCEALIGATYLDGGLPAARALIQESWRSRMLAPRRSLRDPKTALQEWAQARGLAAPTYALVARTGPHHAPEFLMRADVTGFEPLEARGPSKRLAEQAAAQAFLIREGVLEAEEGEARA